MAKSFDELVKRTTAKKTREKAARRAQELLGELLLSEVRELTGKSQRQVADALGMKQPSLSKLEKQKDMQISTLRKIVKALGGELEVFAKFPKGLVKIDQFETRRRKPRPHGPEELQLREEKGASLIILQ
jgi:transcriptional regulator with XRE-family HTH domain